MNGKFITQDDVMYVCSKVLIVSVGMVAYRRLVIVYISSPHSTTF